ncbi:MAG TPA: DinB family protein [Mycobacteriales bacterium]|jgi:hypothetical protein|nr:DinB family protein [Mycobacteriales bacterium]
MIGSDLRHYLQQSRDSLLRALDGLSEYDARRPLTPTGTNLLGLVKHLAGIEAGYLGACAGRPMPVSLPWYDDGSVWAGGDMWAAAGQSRDGIVALYREVWAYADRAIEELPLDHPAVVEWWAPERRHTTFGHLLCRVVAETAQHAGHADILRETLDGRGGNERDEAGWAAFVAEIQAAADAYR